MARREHGTYPDETFAWLSMLAEDTTLWKSLRVPGAHEPPGAVAVVWTGSDGREVVADWDGSRGTLVVLASGPGVLATAGPIVPRDRADFLRRALDWCKGGRDVPFDDGFLDDDEDDHDDEEEEKGQC